MSLKEPKRSDHKIATLALLGSTFSSVVAIFATFVSGIVIARALGPEARGEYGSALFLAQTFATLGMLSFFDGAVIVSRLKRLSARETVPTQFIVALILIVLTVISLFLLMPFIGIDYKDLTFQSHFILSSLVIFFHIIITMLINFDRCDMIFGRINISRIVSPVAITLLILVLYLIFGLKLSVPLALTVFILSKGPEVAIYCARFPSLFGSLSWSFAGEAFIVGLRLHFSIALGVLAGGSDRFTAMAVWPSDLLGQYFVAFSAVNALNSVAISAIRTVMLPYLSGITGEQWHSVINTVFRLAFGTSVGFLVLGVIMLPPMVPIIYGEMYVGAARIVAGLVFAMAIVPLQVIILEANRARGRGLPTILISASVIVVMYLGYLVTGYSTPNELIVTLGASNVAATVIGIGIMLSTGDLKFGRNLVPRWSDVTMIISPLKQILIPRRGGP